MRVETTTAPRNSLILLMGSKKGEIPATLGGNLVASTSSCVAVGTLSESDGPTRIILTDEDTDQNRPGLLGFEGELLAPELNLTVYSIELEPMLEINVPSHHPRIRVFVDHPSEPEVIQIEAL